jgi:hypothetical protein
MGIYVLTGKVQSRFNSEIAAEVHCEIFISFGLLSESVKIKMYKIIILPLKFYLTSVSKTD